MRTAFVAENFVEALELALHFAALAPVSSGAMPKIHWHANIEVESAAWACAFCGESVGNNRGYRGQSQIGGTPDAYIRICPRCDMPAVFGSHGGIYPQKPPGEVVKHLPADVASLYDEARRAAGSGSPTLAVMGCRKLIQNVAVSHGAPQDRQFAFYVEYLLEQHWLPPNAAGWVKYIKDRGNEANHEIKAMTAEDAEALLTLTAALLRHTHELPAKVPPGQ